MAEVWASLGAVTVAASATATAAIGIIVFWLRRPLLLHITAVYLRVLFRCLSVCACVCVLVVFVVADVAVVAIVAKLATLRRRVSE